MDVSVALCTYNGAIHIEEQLLSILNQTVPVDEIVICDDGSKDDTISVIERIAAAHQRVEWKIVCNPHNLGVIRNFEQAISFCHGEYVFLADQDDIWHQDKVQVFREYFHHHPQINVLFSDADLVGTYGQLLTEHTLLDSVYLNSNMKYWNAGLQFEILADINMATGATMAIRQTFVHCVLPLFENKYSLHDEQIAMAACLSDSLAVIPVSLISYRQHGTNVIGVPSSNWVYTGGECPDILESIVSHRGVKDYLGNYKSRDISIGKKIRVAFYCLRKYSCTKAGKAVLALCLPIYFVIYGAYWKDFFMSDLRNKE